MFKEFKKFITRGNVIDLAVGVIIGAAFNKIVSSLVNDIITPIISFLTSFTSMTGFDLSKWKIVLREAVEGVENSEIAIQAGASITYTIDFLITGFAVFLLVKAINKLSEAKSKIAPEEKPAPEPEKPTKKACPFCMSEIAIEATRCPFCTSELDGEKNDADKGTPEETAQGE